MWRTRATPQELVALLHAVLGERVIPVAFSTDGLPLTIGATHPGDVHFSQDYCQFSVLFPTAPQWCEQTERVSIKHKKNPVDICDKTQW